MSSSQITGRPAVGERPSGLKVMIVIALLLHIPLFIYPVLRLCSWLELGSVATTLILVPVTMSQIVSRGLLRGAKNRVTRYVRQIADFLLGMSPIVVMTLLLGELLVLAGVLNTTAAAWSVIVITALISLLGLVMAIRPIVKRISFVADRLKAPVRFVQITDVHIGSRSSRFLRQVVKDIRVLSPDFVCITGDFIDAPGVSVLDLISLKDLDCPIYFTIGNHERYEDLDDILARLTSLGVIVLRNQVFQHRQDLQIVGIDDRDDALQVERQLGKLKVNSESFGLLLYHRPHGLEAIERAGIDLMLSGHTHNGQIFPFHLAVKKAFDRIAGMYELGKSRLYVSQGTGTWGPVMRVGTRAEITLFEIEGNGNG